MIKNVSQWGKDFFNDTANLIYPKKIYKYGDSVFMAGFFVNNGNSFCNDFQIDEDLADFSSISGYLVNFSYWEQYPSQALALPCPNSPTSYYKTEP